MHRPFVKLNVRLRLSKSKEKFSSTSEKLTLSYLKSTNGLNDTPRYLIFQYATIFIQL